MRRCCAAQFSSFLFFPGPFDVSHSICLPVILIALLYPHQRSQRCDLQFRRKELASSSSFSFFFLSPASSSSDGDGGRVKKRAGRKKVRKINWRVKDILDLGASQKYNAIVTHK